VGDTTFFEPRHLLRVFWSVWECECECAIGLSVEMAEPNDDSSVKGTRAVGPGRCDMEEHRMTFLSKKS
jgi:hypothetical protein